jgi:hypothetical protein
MVWWHTQDRELRDKRAKETKNKLTNIGICNTGINKSQALSLCSHYSIRLTVWWDGDRRSLWKKKGGADNMSLRLTSVMTCSNCCDMDRFRTETERIARLECFCLILTSMCIRWLYKGFTTLQASSSIIWYGTNLYIWDWILGGWQ